jgi:hypothetical protein
VEVYTQEMTLWILALGLLLSFGVGVYKNVTSGRSCTLDELIQYLRDVRLESLRELVDLAGEGYLRLNLSPEAFRKLQHNRVHLLKEFLSRMSHNARFLQDWATNECTRSSKTFNEQARASSRELIAFCITFRLAAVLAHSKLLLWSLRIRLLPFAQIPCLAEACHVQGTDWVYTYERIRETASALGRACGTRSAQRLAQVI